MLQCCSVPYRENSLGKSDEIFVWWRKFSLTQTFTQTSNFPDECAYIFRNPMNFFFILIFSHFFVTYAVFVIFQERRNASKRGNSQQTFVGLQDVLKTFSRHVLNTSWTRLQHNNFTSSKTSGRRLVKTKNCYAEDVIKTSWKHALKMSWKHILKKSWRHILKTFSRRLGGKQNF